MLKSFFIFFTSEEIFESEDRKFLITESVGAAKESQYCQWSLVPHFNV